MYRGCTKTDYQTITTIQTKLATICTEDEHKQETKTCTTI